MKSFIRRHRMILITFAIAFAIMTVAFLINGIPVADKQLLVIDSWHQYYPFLSVFHEKLQSFTPLEYSSSIGLGTNFSLLSAYYTNSPVNLLSVFVPSNMLIEFMLFATILKIALAAAFSAIYLRFLARKESWYIVIFSLLYAFSFYIMGYYWCIMWLDSIALLPLIIMGLHKIMEGQRPALYVLTLGIAIISNYYISYMICLFIAIYFLYLNFAGARPRSVRYFFSRTFKVVALSLLAVGVSAFVLLPTVKGMQLASSAKFTFPKTFQITGSFLSVIERMFLGNKPSVVKGDPNVYTGMVSLILVFFYFRSKRINIGSKIASVVLLFVLMLSFNSNVLNFIWHGFHYPNGIPHRFAFVFSFFIMTLAFQGFQNLESEKPSSTMVIAAVIAAFILIAETEGFGHLATILSVGAVMVYALVIYLYQNTQISRKVFTIALSTLIIIEAGGTAILGVSTTGFSARSSYRLYGDDVAKVLKFMRDHDDSEYRTEMCRLYSTNDSSLYGYRGASVFSSTLNANLTEFITKMGAMGNRGSNRFSVGYTTPILNSLLNIKYFIGRNEVENAGFTGTELLTSSNHAHLLQNHYNLNLGFYVLPETADYEHIDSNPFTNQMNLYKAFSGIDTGIFTNIVTSNTESTNMDLYNSETIRTSFNLQSAPVAGNYHATYDITQPGEYNLYVYCPQAEKMYVDITNKPGGPVRSENYEIRRGVIISTGYMEPGSQVNFRFTTDVNTSGYFEYELVKVDFPTFEISHRKLAEHQFETSKFTETKIEGSLDAPRSGYAYFSIPYEKGWSARVNDKKVEISPLQNAFLLVPVEPGHNSIELSYSPDGLKMGQGITMLSLMGLLVIQFWVKISGRIFKNSGKKATGLSQSAGSASVLTNRDLKNEDIDAKESTIPDER